MSTTTLGPTVGLASHAPSPPRYSLLQAVPIVPDADLHYLAGAEVWPWVDARSGGVHNPCATGTNREKNGQQDLPSPLPEFASFTVYVTIECTARSVSEDYDIWAGRAVAALRAVESSLVEEEISRGVRVPLNPHFALDSNILNGGAALGVVDALALLEQESFVTGAAHLVHIDPATSVEASAQNLLDHEGGQCYLVGTGSQVVVGAGYIEANPDGEALATDTLSWAWSTGPIEIRRDEIVVNPPTVREAMERTTNFITIRAERDYLVTWDTVLQDAVLVNRAA